MATDIFMIKRAWWRFMKKALPDNPRWWHFWNPNSGLPGGLLIGIPCVSVSFAFGWQVGALCWGMLIVWFSCAALFHRREVRLRRRLLIDSRQLGRPATQRAMRTRSEIDGEHPQ